MPINQAQYDEKNNLVVVCLFETYLAKFMLEHPEFYQGIYEKVLDVLRDFLTADPNDNPALQIYLSTKGAGYDLSRHVFALFSQLNEHYSEHESFDTLKTNFSLPAADYFMKLIIDEFLTAPLSITADMSPSNALSFERPRLFSPSRRSPFKPSRAPLLFSESNRGAFDRQTSLDADGDMSTQTIGIVSQHYTPEALTGYFKKAICPARFGYEPNEDSHVAKWLRNRHLPVISGASGSTEGLISNFFPLCNLTTIEKSTLIFVQASNMVANGHHSFFEAMIVADHCGFGLSEQTTLLDYYLQCIPESIRRDEAFIAFLNSPLVQPLLEDMPLFVPSLVGCQPGFTAST